MLHDIHFTISFYFGSKGKSTCELVSSAPTTNVVLVSVRGELQWMRSPFLNKHLAGDTFSLSSTDSGGQLVDGDDPKPQNGDCKYTKHCYYFSLLSALSV